MKRYAWTIAAFAWGLAEGTLFFLVPDVILSYIALKFGLRPALTACFFAALGAACGGIIMYLWSAHDPAAARAAVDAVPAISPSMIEIAHRGVYEHWFGAMMQGPLTRTPYKVYAILAPQIGVPLWAFAIGSVFARLPRFLLASALATAVRQWLTPRFSEKQLTWALAAFWLIFYAIFFIVTPGDDPPMVFY